MSRILYIAGLGHSGSTMLDMALGCHPRMVGLGEVRNLIYAKDEQIGSEAFESIRCSCGGDMHQCDFWSPYYEWLKSNRGSSATERWTRLLGHFVSLYGDDTILVDSSKERSAYLPWLARQVDLSVIFLVRDVRSWVYSRYSRHGRPMVALALKWLLSNIRRDRWLRTGGFRTLLVGYEEVALYPDKMLEKICDFMEEPYSRAMLQLDASKSHIIRGNVMRGQKEKREGISYDARWLVSWRASLLLAIPYLGHWNRRHVYRNITRGRTRAFGVNQLDFIVFGDEAKEQAVRELGEERTLCVSDRRFRQRREDTVGHDRGGQGRWG